MTTIQSEMEGEAVEAFIGSGATRSSSKVGVEQHGIIGRGFFGERKGLEKGTLGNGEKQDIIYPIPYDAVEKGQGPVPSFP